MSAWPKTRREFLKASAVAAGTVALGAAGVRISAATEPEALPIGGEPQTFLDDWALASCSDLARTLHQPVKQGLIKEADGSDWQLGSVYRDNVVCRDAAGRFHMTYRYAWWDPGVRVQPTIGEDKAHWFRESVGYATSDDGIRWTKPNLGLVEGPAGFRRTDEFPFLVPTGMSKDNNLGFPLDYVYDLAAHGNLHEPGKRFLVRRMRKDDTHPFAKPVESQVYFAAAWPDVAGDRDWLAKLTPIDGGRLPPRGSIAGFDQAADVWFAVGQDTIGSWKKRGGRDVARCQSPNLVDWTGPELALPVAADESKAPDDWVEYMDMTAYRVGGPQSGAWLGQVVIFHGDRTKPEYQMPGANFDGVWRKGTTEVRLFVSRDAGKSWRPVAGKQVWLPHSDEPHGYDRLAFSQCPVRVGDELWLYYSAWDGDHLVFNRDGSMFEPGYLRTPRTARATLRLHGYVSFDARGREGRLVTRPLRFDGQTLTVNARAPNGWVRAELQDAGGKPLAGFTAADCQSVRGDGVALHVRWSGGESVAALAGRPVRACFTLRDAALFGFQFQA
ncbi:MAG: twin-arginine translocation signal domain-containing protein [Planctomycetia bacterium]|nr:twin-arginine translocation signal domain-containing protein [Planctomycetia bacterium]